MPVGCLGSGRHVDSSLYISEEGRFEDTVDSQDTSDSVSRQAESIALMQQTLLLQIFRTDTTTTTTYTSSTTGEGDCPTCQAFSPTCCQGVEGSKVFRSVQEANTVQYWNIPLVKAVVGLKYQGYVCPGILVTLSDSCDVRVLQEAWDCHALATPPGYTMYRLGLSGGCSVTPFSQAPSPALPETLCWVLSRLKQAECTADMSTILSRLDRDFPALSSPSLPAAVHASLGVLIKSRKVYYTGKGYFLVSPEPSTLPKLKHLPPETRHRPPTSGCRDGSVQTEGGFVGGSWTLSGGSPGPGSQPNTPSQQHRQLGRLNSMSPPGYTLQQAAAAVRSSVTSRSSPRHSPNNIVNTNQQLQQHRHQQHTATNVPSHNSSHSHTSHSPNSSHSSSHDSSLQESPTPRSQTTLERSQSLRVSKKSLKQMSKGGSLRLSKKDALAIMSENEENCCNEQTEDLDSPSPKKMERKNSFLGRIFGRKKSSGGSSGGGNSPKKEILTFSGQFPPLDMEMSGHPRNHPVPPLDLQSVETQTPPHQRRKTSGRPLLPTPPVSTSQVKSGPNGNFVVYEREGGRGVNPANRPLPHSPNSLGDGSQQKPVAENAYNDANSSGHIYSQPTSLYGMSGSGGKPPPPAYSSAPPYRPKTSLSPSPQRAGGGHIMSSLSSPSPQRPVLVTNPKSTGNSSSSPQKQVHFAATPRSNDRNSPPVPSSYQSVKSPPSRRGGSKSNAGGSSGNVVVVNGLSSGPSGGGRHNPAASLVVRGANSESTSSGSSGQSSLLSGPSSLDSVLYDDTLVVIEKSNQELELRLGGLGIGAVSGERHAGGSSGQNNGNNCSGFSTAGNNFVNNRTQISRNRVDTIHNNRHLDQEVIYEDNGGEVAGQLSSGGGLSDLSRSSSASTLKPEDSSTAPDYPSLSDLGSIADLSSKFQSLTARKLIAGLSISSIDTLLEVNAAADSKNNNSSSNCHATGTNNNTNSYGNHNLDESTETIDFGVI